MGYVQIVYCKFILMGLKALVGLPTMSCYLFLNMVEKATKSDSHLLHILTQIHQDLAALNKVHTLSKFHVKYSFQPKEPMSADEKYLLDECCIRAATDLALQQGPEYGFNAQSDLTPRATAFNTL